MRFQIRMVALVHTHVLMAIPVPNMENRLIFSTMRLGRFSMVHFGIGLLVCEAMVTLASHLSGNTSIQLTARDVKEKVFYLAEEGREVIHISEAELITIPSSVNMVGK